MKAAMYIGDGQIEVVERDSVEPSPHEVQIDVAFVGICGTDLHILHGAMDGRVTTPAIIGHEMSGTIAALGDSVTGWNVGDNVTVMPLDWDDKCPACQEGNSHICQNLNFVGIDSPGSLQQKWNVRSDLLVRLPADMDLATAALVEPVAVAVHDVRRANLRKADRAIVLGGGPIGLLIATVAKAEGAEVVVVEPDSHRRTMIRDLGHQTMDPVNENVAKLVDDWTYGAGADVVFEVSGAAAAVTSATSLAKVRGTVVIVAIHGEPRAVDLKQVFWRELSIVGARVYDRSDFERSVELIADGRVPTDAIISATVPLARADEAFKTLEAGQAMKVLVNCQECS